MVVYLSRKSDLPNTTGAKENKDEQTTANIGLFGMLGTLLSTQSRWLGVEISYMWPEDE